MDYVREELARQQAALRQLLTGGEGPAERREDAPDEARAFSTEMDFPVETAAVPEGTAGGPALLPPWAREERAAGSRGRELALREAAPARRRQNERSEELLWDGASAAYPAAQPAETAGAAFDRAAPAPAGPSVRTVVETVTPTISRSARGAAELSRTFQRDARRYDGGFSLY